MAGSLPLERNLQATVRMYVFAAFIGGAIAPALVAGLSVLLKLGIFLPAEHGGVARGPWGQLVLFGAVFACVACGVITWMRQPKGARIAWDDWGITEWDGDGARVAMEWEQVSVTTSFTTLRKLRSHGGSGSTIGGQLTLTDTIGRRIDLTQGTQNVTLNDRLTTVDGLNALSSLVETRPSGMAPLHPHENRAALGILFGTLGYLGSFLGLVAYSAQPSEAAAVLVLLAGAFLMLRSLAFFSRARRDRMRGSVTAVELSGGVKGSVFLSNGQHVDVSRHPDAGLHLRRGAAWLSSTGTLETEGMRQARVARARSNFVSGLGRFLLGAAVFACGTPIAMTFLNAHLQGPDERIKVVWRADDGANGTAIDTIGRRFLVLENSEAVLRDLETGAVITRLPTRKDCSLPSFALSPTHAITSCDEKDARLFALEGTSSREVGTLKGELTIQAVTLGKARFALGDDSGLTSYGTLSDGRTTGFVQAAGADGAQVIRMCEATDQIAFISLMRNEWKAWLATGPVTKRLDVEGRGEALAFSPDCGVLAVSEENEVVLINTSDGKRVDALPLDTKRSLTRVATSLAFSADGNRFAIATEGKLRVYDFTSRKLELDLALEWQNTLVTTATDSPGALAFDGNDTMYFLAKYRGVLLRVSLR
ncbi:MAG: hypothetical protein JNM17_27440 [Archangium sp.]|nr:hypothetical protein [Archangium sp.]